jgi:hypothetical protein
VSPDEAVASVQEVPLDLGASVQNIINMTSWTKEVPLDLGASVQNIINMTSWTKEGMSEPYSSINTFSQLLMIIF